MEKKKKTPTIAIYLGKEPDRARRIKALDNLAAVFHCNRSELIQRIADGDFILTRPEITATAGDDLE